MSPQHVRRATERAPQRILAGILVTDLVSSTELRARLGDLRADEVRRCHERLLRAVVARHRGSVVLWRGDGILAAFPSASAAARAAVAIQQATEREKHRPRRLAVLTVRVGVAAGEVAWTGAECAGLPVDDATEACDAARGGEIRATASALELIGTREPLQTRATADGRFAIEWQPIQSAARRLGLPPGLRTTGQLPFVGRETPIGTLREALDVAVAGEPRLVIVRGEAGIGKTRLVAEIAQRAFAQGVSVLFGSSGEDLAIPYEPIARALRFWMEHTDDLGMRLGPRGGELVRLVPELAEWVPDLPPPTASDAETERLRLYDALGEWVGTTALDDPLLLVLDSLHWASNATYDLLRHILGRLGESRILVLTTHRPSDERTTRLQEWAEAALGPGSAHTIDLEGLCLADVEALVEGADRSRETPAIGGAIHLVTSGNPLHIAALLRHGAPTPDGRPNLPSTVRAALRANVERLEPRVRHLLEAASVLGEEFDAALLPLLLDDGDPAYEALEIAERAGLVREVDRRTLRYRFSHALARDTLYEGMGGARAARMHERAGLILEQRESRAADTELPDLARHFAAAAALGNRERAARYVAQAAARALDQYANEQAAELYTEAIRLLDETRVARVHCELAIGGGEALRRMGDRAYRALLIGAAQRAHALGEGELMARALLGTYRGTFTRALRVDRDHVQRLRLALELLGPADRPLRAKVLALLAVETVWSEDRSASRSFSDEALSIARRIGDDRLVAEVLAHRQWTVFHPFADRLATTAELAELGRASSDPSLRFGIASSETFTRIRGGDRAGLDASMASLRSAASEVDQPLVRWMLLIRESTTALMEGRLDEAEARIEEARTLGQQTGQPDAPQQYAVQRFWLEYEREDPAVARAKLAPLAKIFANLPSIGWAALALRCCDLGMRELAAPILARIREDGIGRIPVDQVWLWRMCQIAEATMRLGDASLAGSLLELLEPCAGEHANITFATLGSVARYIGLLHQVRGRLEDAEICLLAAERSNQAMGAVTWLARTRLDLAALRFHRSGSKDAGGRKLLQRAVDAAHSIRLPTVIEQAARLVER